MGIELPRQTSRHTDPASHLEVTGSNLGPECRLFWSFFVVFLTPSKKIPQQCRKIDYSRFLLYPVQVIIHQSYHSTLYSSLWANGGVVKPQMSNKYERDDIGVPTIELTFHGTISVPTKCSIPLRNECIVPINRLVSRNTIIEFLSVTIILLAWFVLLRYSPVG
jgi:hypothetical protein